ncbi:conserved hypothetical protein [Ricinus communis]|uniref:Uncharacterized protein n=1 Tax=Ricinus communis TaxID=3988 RepID=B9TEU7_RICCO|nr:conserved hypothetical protein [Ricinus communis]
MRASRQAMTLGWPACCASASNVHTPTTGSPVPKAKPCVTPQPIRNPVNEPGPSPNAIPSRSASFQSASSRSSRNKGSTSSECFCPARNSRTRTSPSCQSARERNSVEVSSASSFIGEPRKSAILPQSSGRTASLSLLGNLASKNLDLTPVLLAFDTFALRGAGRAGSTASFRRQSHAIDQFMQPSNGVLPVEILTAKPLCLDDDDAFLVDAVVMQGQEPCFNILRERRSPDIKAQMHGSCDLIHVLAARALRANRGEFDFFLGNGDVSGKGHTK